MTSLSSLSLALLSLSFLTTPVPASEFTFHEATIESIHLAFAQNRLTSRQLVDFYLDRIQTLNPSLRCVLEVNPDALAQADEADRLRAAAAGGNGTLGDLHGIPVLLKDSIGTDDKMNTTAGSYALLGARVPRDAFVVERLRSAGAVILGKASMSEWYSLRSPQMPRGWCARGGQGVNPYVKSVNPCGSSTGSAIAVAANMVTVSLGTETDSSIICPADHNSVVGFKPTVGLTSRAGVMLISPSQDSIGPMSRTVSDAVHVLDAIVGFDPRDEATEEAAKFIPMGGYKQFLREDGLNGKRLGIVRHPFSDYKGSTAASIFDQHLLTFGSKGATLVDNLEIENIDIILKPSRNGEMTVLRAQFKHYINEYLGGLSNSPVKSLAEVIAFNSNNPDLEKMEKYNQDGLIAAQITSILDDDVVKAQHRMKKLSEEGFEKLMKENELDAMVTLGSNAATIPAFGGYPVLTVPAGYDDNGMPFGICFGGLKGSEAKLIEIAYSFELATRMHDLDEQLNYGHRASTCLYQSRVLLILIATELVERRTVALARALSLEEASARDLQLAFRQDKLTSRQLTKFYLYRIRRLNPLLRGVLEVNPDALRQADRADRERKAKPHGLLLVLHGIPVLLKDNIATKDKMNTTAGSFALLGSVVPRDAGVVARLRSARTVLLGKASLSEWAHYRFSGGHSGWCARSGQGKNPYNLSADPWGSSSGSAISVAANMGAVSLGTETDGSILGPSSSNSVVGIKPTVGLTSRSGVVPLAPRQDTVGPICRTVADAVNVLDVIVGFDPYDAEATREASKYIPRGGYNQFLKADGLRGKRLGIVRKLYYSRSGSQVAKAFESHLNTLRKQGAVLLDHLELANIDEIFYNSGEDAEMSAEFKLALNTYLQDLVISPVRSLTDVIEFNNKHKHVEKINEFGQDLFLTAQATNGIDEAVKSAWRNMDRLSRDGLEKLMKQNQLDALVTPRHLISQVLAIGGFPGINVPAGYDQEGVPFGICFGGLRGSEPTLIEIAYGFEQATKIRRPPSFMQGSR